MATNFLLLTSSHAQLLQAYSAAAFLAIKICQWLKSSALLAESKRLITTHHSLRMLVLTANFEALVVFPQLGGSATQPFTWQGANFLPAPFPSEAAEFGVSDGGVPWSTVSLPAGEVEGVITCECFLSEVAALMAGDSSKTRSTAGEVSGAPDPTAIGLDISAPTRPACRANAEIADQP
eukprot:CAMPEP_0177778988 /NCGR_PEP_ID=MMETSP0491_2-20121128/16294_1 /TAXON_ID=63592 /ORGANISM="Tetraselmis chuii, Strain PLY429" /LENGTH=178 /DNA_ID=CAMNT_0019298391 /DNA_START=1858 /DNA_END=2395 /DNA_ORIENTATION=-